MPPCGGKNRLIFSELSTKITPELIEVMEAHDAKLEALKQTDPTEYERVMQPTVRLRRWLAGMKLATRK